MANSVVTIRELRNRLSYYLRLVSQGESLTVTKRGVPIARIAPVERSRGRRLSAMLEAGQIEWSGEKLAHREPVAKAAEGYSVAQLLVRDR